MRHFYKTLLLLLLVALMAAPAGATERKTLRYGGGGQGTVVFDGPLHASKGFVCNDCHVSIFPPAQKAHITMEDHFKGVACFTCHNQVVVSRDCGFCHRKFEPAPLSTTFNMADSPEGNVPAPVALKKTRQELQSPLTYEGASTVGSMIMPEAAKLFTAHTGVPFGEMGIAGAGAGLKAVAAGKVSMGGLASAITDKEKAQVVAWQVIGYDVMGVFVHPSNPVRSLTMDQLRAIFSGRETNWKAFGGPDAPIVVYSEALAGGRATVKAFQDMVLRGDAYGKLVELDDAVDCVADVAKDPAGITASSLSFAIPGVEVLKVNGAAPEKAAVQSGAYPLKRPLTLITLQPTGNIQAFFDFMLSPEGQDVVSKHFVPVK
ncbi:substrate-binding domain-containing protein [Desulfovibrio sp. 86]|uniref:Phosphate binding protein (Modular protein) n=1 Tax=uncultured Desulfovibrio sp. TaxID=167968 RepID=A0A212L651_9BACT|nr:substrate-binding domain-containing protein [Desulfovibrio sp. 86]SCM73043.1 Phosphate binding protein (modular protein) [uncultured Desulfovibrio sp.]VZH33897.1 Phosphate binding protein (Modular protein) [Desulfovibrio sp. 86]